MTTYRRAWIMELQEGAEELYDDAHVAIWPELTDQMLRDGIRRFQLYRSGRTVFAYQERMEPFPSKNSPTSEVAEKWWKEMSRLMVTEADGRPRHRVLRQVFSLEETLSEKDMTE